MQLAEITPRAHRLHIHARARALAAPVAAGTVVSFLFVLLMAGGFHSPAPHGLPVALSASPAAAAKIGSALAHGAPGAFTLHRYASEAAVEAAVAHGDAVGGFALGGGGATIVTAGAQGVATGQAIQEAFGKVAGSTGAVARKVDVAPLPARDSFGLSGFMVVVGLTMASAVFAAAAFAAARSLELRSLLAGTIAFALLAGGAAALSVDTTVGAIGHFWAVAGLGALLALAVGATVLGLGRLLGAAGLGLGALLVALTSISTSGSVVGYRFEPAFHRALSQWLPAGSAVEAMRDVLYFGGAHAGGGLAVLAAWAVAGLALLALGDLVRARRHPDAAVRP